MLNVKRDVAMTSLVHSLKIAAPCNISWDSMKGDERVRHCGQCNKNVYSISNMTESEANEFLRLTNGKACVNFYRRTDGTILLDNCPVGLRKLRTHYRWVAAAITTIISIAQGFVLTTFAGEAGKGALANPNCAPDNSSLFGFAVNGGGAPMPTLPPPTLISADRRGGELDATVKLPDAVRAYEEKVETMIATAMPRYGKTGNAAIAVSINSNGSVKSVKLVCKSPTKTVDNLILKSVKDLSFGSPPPGFFKRKTPPIYYFEYRLDRH